MTFADEMERLIEKLPIDAADVCIEDLRALSAINRRWADRRRATANIVKRYRAKFSTPLAKVELEELRAALLTLRDDLRAAGVYNAWMRSSGMETRDVRLAQSHAKSLRDDKVLRKMLREFGDLESPSWRPGWRARLRHRLPAR